MKVNYINALLFALPLNIFVTLYHEHNKRNHKSPTPHDTQTNRSLCECELYAPANYDSYPEMKRVMQQFQDRTSQRFEEYEERMKTARQKCKDKCDKEIQKIILKDKLEKELMEKFATLQTDIQNDAIPTCICEKSLADKAEKFCLNCGMNVGGGVTLSSGVLGGIGEVTLSALRTAALETVKEVAIAKGLAAGEAARIPEAIKAVIEGLEKAFPIEKLGFSKMELFINKINYNKVKLISDAINMHYEMKCLPNYKVSGVDTSMCEIIQKVGLVPGTSNVDISTEASINIAVEKIVTHSQSVAAAKVGEITTAKTAAFEKTKMAAVEAGFNSSITSINASIITILIIVLIMVIIYLILRYRRKKKMNKKLQYIKLLKE
ncbi:rifin [Plasmodium reichenowi]|uniref:Rifin n=1 Tax=Plasmodium reichenowi TaxID=5854 RepID=A0A060RQZ6_PLARE|nr:rifin [Plasmodium reichenowi]